ncbi:MAG TPA: phage/plasmid primase, P4 family [Bryobacteraceae bacterium]|nr:phage/plasmid primase, P4 family [Bryobacteraceae bacterium]
MYERETDVTEALPQNSTASKEALIGAKGPQPATEKSRPVRKGRRRRGARPGEPDLLCYPYTDTGNAERLVHLFGAQIRYCPEMKKWLVWDFKRWVPDTSGKARRLAKITVRNFYAQAAGIDDEKAREAAEGFARHSESAGSIRAMLECAQYEDGIAICAKELDSDPWLLNCLDGTIDLRTGQLRPHRQQDLITKLCPVKYDASAPCPRFMQFLDRILGANPALIAYVQRVFGYALTGDVNEKACFCLFGEGNNGKTTLLELFRYIMGDYAAQVMIDTLMTRRSQESNASLADLADLRGARFVTTSETEEGQRLAEGKLKYVTGMSEIKRCRKYENPITFPPTHKIFMDANHRPVVRGADSAIWSRLKLIPFTITIPKNEMDAHLLDKLKAEAPGVLAWAVKGGLDWQREGLVEPQEVLASVATWKCEDDPFKEFFEDRCEFSAAEATPVTNMWSEFCVWAEENGIKYPSRTRLYERLRLRGCSKAVERDESGKQVRCWKGVKLI